MNVERVMEIIGEQHFAWLKEFSSHSSSFNGGALYALEDLMDRIKVEKETGEKA